MSASPPPEHPSDERTEWRAALLAYGPAVVVAFLLEMVLSDRLGWSGRRAMVTSILVGILLAVVLQRVLERRRRR